MEEKISYEEAFGRLEQIAKDIENETISVDELADKVKEASVLIQLCQERLRATEGEVSKIIGQMGGNG